MTYREEHTTIREGVDEPLDSHSHTSVTHRISPGAVVERAIIFVFGLIQLLIVLRILLLLVAAREGNAIVAFVYDISEILVAPFRGILRLNEVSAGQAELDIAAIVALIGWTVLEFVIIGLIRVVRPSATA